MRAPVRLANRADLQHIRASECPSFNPQRGVVQLDFPQLINSRICKGQEFALHSSADPMRQNTRDFSSGGHCQGRKM